MCIEVFQHVPLDLERSSFRLLRLLRGDSLDLTCDIFQAYHDDESGGGAVSYEALSYAWGAASQEEYSISMTGGSIMKIGANLFEALRNLRLPDRDRILWVDAVCIDQQNPKERGHQVRQMGDIYRLADRVLFWLGSATFETDITMELLKRLQEVTLQHMCWKWNRNDKRWTSLWIEALEAAKSKFPGVRYTTVQDGMRSLLDRPWFTRVWILQEAANARSGFVCCGSKSVSSRVFTLGPGLMGVQPTAQCQAVLSIMPGPWRSAHQQHGRSLYNLLCAFAESQASDPRDLIYALLGISYDAKDCATLRPDYEKAEQDLVRDTVRFLYLCDLPDHQTPETVEDLIRQLQNLNYIAVNTLAEWGETKKLATMFQRNGVTFTKETLEATSTLTRRAFLSVFNLVLQLGIERGDVTCEIDDKIRRGRPYAAPAQHEANFPTWTSNATSPRRPNLSPDSVHFRIWVAWNQERGKNRIRISPLTLGQGGVRAYIPPFIQWMAQAQSKTCSSGQTLLGLASEQGNIDIVMALLSQNTNAYMNRPDRLGRTPLIWAAREGHNFVLKELLNAGANLNAQDTAGRTALAWAAFNGHTCVVESLLRNNASNREMVNLKDKRGMAALSLAASQGNLAAVELLLADKADLESQCTLGRTPLFWAVLNEHKAVSTVLLQRGADPNCQRDAQSEQRTRSLPECLGGTGEKGAPRN